jgi:hypothetical protein
MLATILYVFILPRRDYHSLFYHRGYTDLFFVARGVELCIPYPLIDLNKTEGVENFEKNFFSLPLNP